MTRIVIRSSFGPELEVEQSVFNNGFYPGYSYVRDAGGSSGPYVPPWEDSDLAAAVANASSAVRAALGAVPVTDSQLPTRLSDVSLKAAIDAEAPVATKTYVGPAAPTPPTGTEYVWMKTDGSGNLLDILAGVA